MSACHLTRLRRQLLAGLLGLLAGSGGASADVLDVPLIPQRSKVWCWAASAEMARDFLYPGMAKDTGQCTLAHDALPQCVCEKPDKYPGSLDCGKTTPYGPQDYMLTLLLRPNTIKPFGTTVAPISHELLACEINIRKAPVVFWWKDDGQACEDDGHLAVASGLLDTMKGPFVLALDPWPPADDKNGGEAYWLSWRGFACGRSGGGHCISYFDLKGKVPAGPCMPSTATSTVDCFAEAGPLEKVANAADVERYLRELLAGASGPQLRSALELPNGELTASCDTRFLLREAVPAVVNGSASYEPTRRTRIFCDLVTSASTVKVSVMLFSTADDWAPFYVFAGFGRGKWTDWLAVEAERLLASANVPLAAFVTHELVELFVPGRGQGMLIYERKDGPPFATRFGSPHGAVPTTWGQVLEERDTPDGPTIGDIILSWGH